VIDVAPLTVPAAPVPGQSWIVGASPTGAWAGHSGHIACWTDGGWRFAVPVSGMSCWSLADSLPVQFGTSGWIKGRLTGSSVYTGNQQVVGPRQSAVADPTGGTVIDAEARLAVAQLLAKLRTHGLIST
jgi:Protein of unknown function (DUF2793)